MENNTFDIRKAFADLRSSAFADKKVPDEVLQRIDELTDLTRESPAAKTARQKELDKEIADNVAALQTAIADYPANCEHVVMLVNTLTSQLSERREICL